MFLSKQMSCICRLLQNVNITVSKKIYKPLQSTVVPSINCNKLKNFHTSSQHHIRDPTGQKDRVTISEGENKYEPQSPYRSNWPKNYGVVTSYEFGPTLPRVDDPIKHPLKHKQRNNWTRYKAVFGQNDYIDILGDGDIHPVDLIKGPKHLIGFNANELRRLRRQLRFSGATLNYYFPTKYAKILKRIKFLHKKHNFKRGKRVRPRS